MKVTSVVTTTNMEEEALLVAQQTLNRLMTTVGLRHAVANAPGSTLPRSIKVGPVRVVGNGQFRVALSFPGRYKPVEYGAGVFVGRPAMLLKPRKFRALNTPYGYFKTVKWVGQEPQKFATNALEEVALKFPKEFANDLNAALSRGSGRKTTVRLRRR